MSNQYVTIPKIAKIFAVAGVMAASLINSANATFTITYVQQHDGQTVIVTQDVGNQMAPYQWVENDSRRHSDNGLVLYYRIDRNELPNGISWEQTEKVIESAVATFNNQVCGHNMRLVRVDADDATDFGVVQSQYGMGGNATHKADITFAGWVPQSFFNAIAAPRANAIAIPAVIKSDNQTVEYGLTATQEGLSYSDVNKDRKYDLFATEIYFNRNSNYVIDNDELGNTLYYIDLESIVLHELGHALGMHHFGRSKIILNEYGEFVDLIINQNSGNVMNTNNYFVRTELSGQDKASFCEIYSNWGAGKGGGK